MAGLRRHEARGGRGDEGRPCRRGSPRTGERPRHRVNVQVEPLVEEALGNLDEVTAPDDLDLRVRRLSKTRRPCRGTWRSHRSCAPSRNTPWTIVTASIPRELGLERSATLEEVRAHTASSSSRVASGPRRPDAHEHRGAQRRVRDPQRPRDARPVRPRPADVHGRLYDWFEERMRVWATAECVVRQVAVRTDHLSARRQGVHRQQLPPSRRALLLERSSAGRLPRAEEAPTLPPARSRAATRRAAGLEP